jgi:membrane-associated phospholipid phosphatase
MKFHRAVAILIALLILASRTRAQSLPAAEAESDTRPDATIEPLTSPTLLLQRIATDQKRIWMFPVEAARGKHWKPALAVLGATAGLMALDPTDTRLVQRVSFQQTPVIHGINRVLSGTNTGVLIAAVPISFYLAGLARKDSYARQTALLAGEAVANAEIVTIAIKDIDLRMRPSEIGPNGNFSNTWFRTDNRSIGGFGSFSSGHTAAAFSVATVYAECYKNHRWAPWIAYGLASVVGLSRLNAQAHFPSDIFFGAALGYAVSHFVVLRLIVGIPPALGRLS